MSNYILLGHGSRNPEANEVLYNLADQFKNEAKADTKAAFLQFAEPTLESVIEQYYQEGIKNIIVIPVFLYPGIHIKEDVPEIIDQLHKKYPELTVKVGDPIGADPKLVSVLQDRAKAVNC